MVRWTREVRVFINVKEKGRVHFRTGDLIRPLIQEGWGRERLSFRRVDSRGFLVTGPQETSKGQNCWRINTVGDLRKELERRRNVRPW